MPKGFALRFLGLFFVILDFLSGFAAYFAGFVTAAFYRASPALLPP
jgi:hypothetical protein